jgi:hypothetical protein
MLMVILQLILHEMLTAMLQLLAISWNLTIFYTLLVQTSPSKQHCHKKGKFLFFNPFWIIFWLVFFQIFDNMDENVDRVTSMHGHSSHNTTIFVFYLIYRLHVLAIINSAIIRLDTIVRETGF